MIRRFVPMTLILGLFDFHRNLLWRGHTGSRGRQPVPPIRTVILTQLGLSLYSGPL